MTGEEISASVRAFLEENFLYMRPDLELHDDDDLLDAEVIDSTGVMELVAFVEDHFGVRVPDADIAIENFGSIKALAAYVGSRTG